MDELPNRQMSKGANDQMTKWQMTKQRQADWELWEEPRRKTEQSQRWTREPPGPCQTESSCKP
jgi:hypothetical protein